MVEWMESVDSTNQVARRLADEGAPHGTAIAAHHQTAGRGRLGRAWHAPPGNLNLSVVLRGGWDPEALPWITLGAGVVVAEVLGPAFQLKWPNDLLDRAGKKVCGILAEAEWAAGGLAYVVVGIGVNVEHAPPDLPATSLRAHGIQTPLEVLAERIAKGVTEMTVGRVPDAWKARNCTLGRSVVVGDVAGQAVGLDQDGALLILTPEGLRRVISGDLGFAPG